MAEKVESQQLNDSELEELERLAYTKKRYLSPKEIAAFVLVNFGKKNLDQFTSAFKEFFMIQFLKLNTTAYANINLFASIYDAADDTISGLIIDRTRTRWGRILDSVPAYVAHRRLYDVYRSGSEFHTKDRLVRHRHITVRSGYELLWRLLAACL